MWNRSSGGVSHDRRASRLQIILVGIVGVTLGLAALWFVYDTVGDAAGTRAGRPTAIHPDARYLDRPDGVPVLKAEEEAPDQTAAGAEIRRRFQEAKVVATLGEATGPPETIFGQVLGAAFHRSGKLFVLDGAFYEVRVFEPDGSYLTTVGGRGQGPGELAVPAVVAVSKDRLLVGESDFQLEIYEIGSDAIHHSRRLVTDSVPVVGVCGTPEGFIVDGVHYDTDPTMPGTDMRIVHVLDSEGAIEKSFGTVYRSPGAMLNATLSEAWITCVPEHDLIVLAPKSGLGEVRAYSTEGELRWILEFEKFLAYQTFEYVTDRGLPRYSNVISPEGLDRIESIQLIDGRNVLVQIGRAVRDTKVDPFYVASVRSYLVDVDTGQGTFVGTDIPVVIAADGRRIATLETVENVTEPYPRVRILEWATPVDGWGEAK